MARLSAGGSFQEEVGERPQKLRGWWSAGGPLRCRADGSSPSLPQPDGAVPASTHERFNLTQDTSQKKYVPEPRTHEMVKTQIRLREEALPLWCLISHFLEVIVSILGLFLEEEYPQKTSPKEHQVYVHHYQSPPSSVA